MTSMNDTPRQAPERKRRHIGLLLFDGVEELDAVGPWEVLANWTQSHPEDGWSVSCLSSGGREVLGAKGMVLGAQHSLRDAPSLDVLIHPGGPGTRSLMRNRDHLAWIRRMRAEVAIMASVCTGSLVYAAAGLLVGATGDDALAVPEPALGVDPTIITDVDARYVDNGDVITSAGVSAGIDMALHLVDRLVGGDRAREVRRDIQYDPQPARLTPPRPVRTWPALHPRASPLRRAAQMLARRQERLVALLSWRAAIPFGLGSPTPNSSTEI